MSSTGGLPQGHLQAMPNEVLLRIMENMTPGALLNLRLSNPMFDALFRRNRAITIVRALRTLPELPLLLYLYTSDEEELQPACLLRPRVIDYVGQPTPVNLMSVDDSYQLFPGITAPKHVLEFHDVEKLWKRAKVIDWWVDLYAAIRWRDNPQDRRSLRPGEADRVRKAVAHWWLYAHYHHGFTYWRRSFHQPKRWESSDTRLMLIRYMPTNEIRELADLWCRVRDTVSRDLCSSPERVCRCTNPDGVDLIPWGAEEGRHRKIVRTYMKLDPEQLQYYLSRYAYWRKAPTIKAISGCSRDFSRDTETLSTSLNKVLEERMAVHGDVNWSTLPRFGILDEDRADEQANAEWMNDAWPGGQVPLTVDEISGLPPDTSSLACKGDDGTDAFIPYWKHGRKCRRCPTCRKQIVPSNILPMPDQLRPENSPIPTLPKEPPIVIPVNPRPHDLPPDELLDAV
ncbi:hypothetical protein F4776DRAFT_672470 [Hypoxylon sp. NC0597]|nr:hypothetical protein F4776DRAFT_672470 [Hypoxylon sp. NC0597]